MLPHPTTAPQPPAGPPARIGVGIDTSRYGHYAAFLRDDLQPAAPELPFAESAEGYAQLRQRLEQVARRHPAVAFVVRLDAAGQYADNLLHFLHHLAQKPPSQAAAIPNAHLLISCGDPQRNKNYRAALFGSKKSDPAEARAAAHFALSQRPAPTPPLPTALRTLRQVAARLQATVRQRTRLRNQFHHLLALTFPERALRVQDIAQGWALELVHRYPTAPRLAAAAAEGLARIPYRPGQHRTPLLQQARSSIAALSGPTAAELVRDQVRPIRDANARHKRLENLRLPAYRAWPRPNHLDTIPGSGAVTAAVRTACIRDSDRFDTPGQRVASFGALPIAMSSGVDRDGQPRGPRRYVRSRRGNDLVRRYLWRAALSAVRCNPAVRALYRRVVAKHPQRKAVAIGHALRKLLHLAFALWKSDKPFDAQHYPWEKPMPVAADDAATGPAQPPDPEPTPASQAAGHKPESKPARTVVTAACPPHGTASGAGRRGDLHRLRPPQAATVDGPGAGASGAEVAPAGPRPAAPRCLPDPSRRRPRSHLQRPPGGQRVPLLRQGVRPAR